PNPLCVRWTTATVVHRTQSPAGALARRGDRLVVLGLGDATVGERLLVFFDQDTGVLGLGPGLVDAVGHLGDALVVRPVVVRLLVRPVVGRPVLGRPVLGRPLLGRRCLGRRCVVGLVDLGLFLAAHG